MLCTFAEAFCCGSWWLIRESRHLAPHTGKADRTRGPMSRTGEPIPMNSGTTQDECRKGNKERTVLMVLGALLFTISLHGQRTRPPDLRKDENRLNLAILVML